MNGKYDLRKDDAFFLSVLETLMPEHAKRFAVVHCENIAGIFDTREEAAQFGMKNFAYGEYLISQVIRQEDAPKFMSFRYALI